MPDKIQIAFCFDGPMVLPACVAISSLVKAARSPFHVHACVGSDEATIDILRRNFRDLASDFDIHTGTPEVAYELPSISPYGEQSTAAYRRIFLADLLAGIDRVIYIDVDVLVRRDLRRLWQTDLNGLPFGAVPELSWAADPARLTMFPAGYFNSGFLLQDLPAWRREGLTDRVIDYIRAWRAGRQIGLAPVSAGASPPKLWGFQNEMNAALAGRWRPLGQEWNYSFHHRDPAAPTLGLTADEMAHAQNNPAIVHFQGPGKPWSAPFARLTRYHEEYQKFRSGVEAERQTQAVAWPRPYGMHGNRRRRRRALGMALIARARAKDVRRAALAGNQLIAAEVIALERNRFDRITAVGEVVGAFCGGEVTEETTDGAPQGFDGSRRFLA